MVMVVAMLVVLIMVLVTSSFCLSLVMSLCSILYKCMTSDLFFLLMSKPYPEHSVEYSHFIKSSRSGRRNAVANILDEPQVAANLPILTLPADLSELKVTGKIMYRLDDVKVRR